MSIEKLKDAFRSGLSLDPGVEVTGLRYRDFAGWDSVAHMTLIAAIESAFDIMIDTDDVIDMSSWDKAVEIVRKYGVQV
jgi:acyl carrier protein